ncbi:hypothetical protein D3C76_1168860 [compost metagenome]
MPFSVGALSVLAETVNVALVGIGSGVAVAAGVVPPVPVPVPGADVGCGVDTGVLWTLKLIIPLF